MTRFAAIKPKDVLNSLRLWHGGHVERWPLAHLRLRLMLINQEKENESLAEAGPAAQNRAILNYGLYRLKAMVPEAEELLRDRFEHKQDVLALANRLNISDSTLFYRQRQAIDQLTEILITFENQAGADWQKKMRARLPLSSYHKLIGVKQARITLLEALTTPATENHIFAIDGIGGIGKTALADKLTRDLINAMKFDEFAWITAKHTHLSTAGRLQIESGRPALTFSMLVDRLAKQFDIPPQPTQLQMQREVKRVLTERQCLIVIDNLETVADYHSLLPELRKWQNPSKFLLTSRLRLLDEPNVFSISLRELNEVDARQLLRHEAKVAGFQSLLDANDQELQKIYEVVGGNPLALKLVIGQLKYHSLPRVLKKFAQSQNRSTQEGIFDYIYQEIWGVLSNESKATLLALTQAGESGFTFDHLVDISGLTEIDLTKSLEELITLSLVDLSGTLIERRYRLHRLTEIFLLRTFSD